MPLSLEKNITHSSQSHTLFENKRKNYFITLHIMTKKMNITS